MPMLLVRGPHSEGRGSNALSFPRLVPPPPRQGCCPHWSLHPTAGEGGARLRPSPGDKEGLGCRRRFSGAEAEAWGF